jgi:hypothetical protein
MSSLRCQHSLHVGGDKDSHHSRVRMLNQIGDFCAPDLVLAGKTGGIRAGAADQFPFDDGAAMPTWPYQASNFAACSATRTSIS